VVKAFGSLAAQLHPDLPEQRPAWVSVELSRPNDIPGFRWNITQDQGNWQSALSLDAGEIHLSMADQTDGRSGVDRRTVAVAAPVATFSRSGGTVTLTLVTLAPATAGGSLKYEAKVGRPWTENIELTNLSCEYDAVEVASMLRAQTGLATPLLTDAADKAVHRCWPDLPNWKTAGRNCRSLT